MEDKKINIKDNKKIVLGIAGIIIIVIIIAFLKYLNNPVVKFKQNLDNVDVSKLQEIYSTTQSYDEKKKIEKIFQDKLKYLVESFVNGSKDYDNTIEEINRYSNIKEFENSIKSAKDDIENVKSSKDSFVEGQKYEKDENILEAIKSYSKVIELDKNNYKVAQDYIKNNKENLKDKTLAEVDSLISNNDYVTANQKIKDLQDVISNDTEITEKSNQIKDKAKEQEIEKYKNEQEVTVESAKILVQDDRYKSLYPDMIEVVIKNNSNKTIKDLQCSSFSLW